MKKLLTLVLLALLSFPITNVYSVSSIYVAEIFGVKQIDTAGNVLNQDTFSGVSEAFIVDQLDNVYVGTRTDGVIKYDSNLNLIWNNTNSTRVDALAFDDLGNVYSGSNDDTVRKYDSNGNQLWSFTGHTADVLGVAVDSNQNVYSVSFDSTLRKINSSGQQQWVVNTGAGTREVVTDSNDNIYIANFNNDVKKYDSNGNLVWTTNISTSVPTLKMTFTDELYGMDTGSLSQHNIYNIDKNNGALTTSYSMVNATTTFSDDFVVDATGNIYFSYRKFNTSLSSYEYFLDTIFNGSVTNTIQGATNFRFLALPYEIPEPSTYNVELQTNTPYNDFIYQDDEINVTTNSVITTILNDESFTVTSSGLSTGSYTFNYWYDLDNMEIFTTDRNFTIIDPNRNYNLIADYTLDSFNTFNINSNLPSPQDFTLNTTTLEGESLTINQTEFDNYQHPDDRDWEIIAPVNNIGFYEFDYYYDNDENDIHSFNNVITGSGFSPPNLTAVYSLPEEYQINLIIESNIGNIIFQHGENDPISGPFISQTIGLGDNWTATAPNNEDYQFNVWFDLNDVSNFSNNQTINISNTNKDYYLEALYFELVEITWDSNGGTSIPNQKVIIGSSVQPPNDPIRPGFVFDYWEDSDNNEVIFPKNISENVTFTAVWIETFTLTYDTNGGGRIDADTYLENSIPEVVTPSRFGYEFTGWFTDDGTFQNAYDFTDPITQDTTIHARWAFGSDRDAQLSLTTFLDDNDLGDGFSQIVIMIAIYIFVNIIIFIYQAPLIVTLILNFIVTSLFMILGWIAIWIVVVIFMALFGLLYFFSSGRGITE